MKKVHAMAAVAAALTLIWTAPAVAAQQLPKRDRTALTTIVKKGMAAQRLPGVSVGVWIPGRGQWTRSFGKANRRTGRPFRASDHVRIASISKSFTATAVLQLVDAGKLSLDDHLEAFVPGIPNGNVITVRQLLGMTTGIYDYTVDKQFGRDFARNPLMAFTPQSAIDIVLRHKPDFAPGAKVAYADTNYVLLGLIVEKVTGRPLADVIKTGILDPLGLRHTSYPSTPAIPTPYARGYYAGDDGKGALRDYTRINPGVAGAAGAMISTLGDLRIWARALATGNLLKPATQAERVKLGTLHVPGPLKVGYGLGVFGINGFIGHNGAIYGYSTAMFYLPKARATIVVEGNKATNFSSETTDLFVQMAVQLFPAQFKGLG